MKKKTKRVESRRSGQGKLWAKWQQWASTGAPVSVAMLVLFILAVSAILAMGQGFNRVTGELIWSFQKFFSVLILMFMLGCALGLYVTAYEPLLVKNHLRGFVLLFMLLMMTGLVQFGMIQDWANPYLIVIPVVMVTAIMMTIAYSQRFALGVGTFLALVSILTMGNGTAFQEGLAVLLTTGVGMGIAILSLRQINSRTRLIEVCALSAVAVFAMVWVMHIWQESTAEAIDIWWKSFSAAMGALAVGFVMQGLLPVIEKLFNTATNMTLLDYSEANKPLLKRLAVEAPGTFNHSWQIGMLAEAAAEEIGANGLLCRVGSYYHDIGKTNKPQFFVENQGESFSHHKGLTPTMSKMIIIGHVKDGLELAREYKIPKVLHQFIATHHGTTVVEYFYKVAARNDSENGRSIEDTDFRYPGPKPQTKETAIVMIGDGIESATRALPDPTPSRIETLVNNIIMKRLLDGQFDECDLTMRELRLIETRMVKTLCGMYHGRISYLIDEKPPKEEKPNGSNQN